MGKLQLAIWISILLTESACSNVTSLGCKGAKCYWVVGPSVHWHEAGQLCTSFNGSSLVTIEDSETNTFLWTKTFHLGVTPWIGVASVSVPWHWTDGTPYTGNKLETPSPDQCQNCALAKLNTINSEVDVTAGHCLDERRAFICSRKGAIPTASSITIHSALETWYNARLRCRDAGLVLAVFPGITLESVVAHIKSQTFVVEFWIGLYSRKWISTATGQELTFLKINGDCHSGYSLKGSGVWHSECVGCYHKAPSLCSLGGSMPIPPSNRVNNQQNPSTPVGFDIVHKVVIPVVCVIGGCVITIAIVCLIWRKAKASHVDNEVARRMESMAKSDSNHNGKATGYDNLGHKALRDKQVYEDLDRNAHTYVEIVN